MTNIAKVNADFYPERMNMYVPAMRFASDCGDDGLYQISLGTPPIAVNDAIVAAQSTAAAGNSDLDYTMVTCKYGRIVTVNSDGANTDVVTITGYDYLGQKITETITLNGAATVLGLKAFKRVTNVAWLLEAGRTLDVGFGDVLGLPYKTMAINNEIFGDVAQSAGSFTAPVLTDPQTIATGDPRGKYNPTGTLDGATELVIHAIASNAVNAAGNGGLHSIAHYSA